MQEQTPEKAPLSSTLKDIFPDNYSYLCLSYSPSESFQNEPRFSVKFQVNLFTKDEVSNWLKKFQDKSCTTWRVRRTFPDVNYFDRMSYKIDYRCQHNTRRPNKKVKVPHEKHTSCPSSMIITIRKVVEISKETENFLSHPCLITLRHNHNHLIYSPEFLKYRDPSNEVRERFIELFRFHSPSTALDAYKQDLKLKYKDDFDRIAADRNIMPDKFWVYRLYYSTVQDQHSGDGQHVEVEQLEANSHHIIIETFYEAVDENLASDGNLAELHAPVPTNSEAILVIEPQPVDYSSQISETLTVTEEFCEEIKRKIVENPGQYCDAVLAAFSAFNQINEDDKKVAALCNFGKHCSENVANESTITEITVGESEPGMGHCVNVLPMKKRKFEDHQIIAFDHLIYQSFLKEHDYAKLIKVDPV